MQHSKPNGHPRRLWHFHGGLHLADRKALSNTRPIRRLDLPERLVLPLQQHIGAAAEPQVQVGERVLKGQRIAIAKGYVSAPIHAPSSGTVTGIEDLPVAHPSGLSAPCIVIATDGEDQWAQGPEPMPDFIAGDPAQLRERIRWAGIVGMGGAAFPTSVKLNPGPDYPIDTLIVNGAECEPYITCDDLLMRERSGDILLGIRILRHLLAFKECLIGIENNKPEAIESMRLALAESDLQGCTAVAVIPTLYPSGGEKQLIRVLTGKEVPSNGIPARIGILCQNVATLTQVAAAVLEGKPLISRIVTLTGEGIVAPQNLEVPIGTPAADLIEACGGYSDAVQRLILGGPMMGFALHTDAVPITKAANCLLAVSATEAPDPGPARACIRCGECARVCPANLLPQQMYWYARAKNLEKVQDYHLFDCIDCGCCSHVCPAHIPLVQYFRYAKTESWAQEQEKRQAEHARQRHEARQARLRRLERERQARLRKKKEALENRPGKDAAQDPKKAAVAAAMQRAAARKAGLSKQGVVPKNTRDLNPAQQRQVESADARRSAAAQAATTAHDPAPEE